jgi:hypothetical protein
MNCYQPVAVAASGLQGRPRVSARAMATTGTSCACMCMDTWFAIFVGLVWMGAVERIILVTVHSSVLATRKYKNTVPSPG